MTKRPVTIQNNMDMEDRPIAHLVQINAKSIMGMMSLKLQKGECITVVAEGQDEHEAVAGIEGFLVASN